MAQKKKAEIDLAPLAAALEEATMQFKASMLEGQGGGGPALEGRLEALEALLNKLDKKLKSLDKSVKAGVDEETVRAIAREVIRKAFSSMAGGGGPVVE